MASPGGFVHFTNCRLAIGIKLVKQDLWIDTATGKIVDAQAAFFDSPSFTTNPSRPVQTIDLKNRILSPGFIECQLNGGYGFDFSVPSPAYAEQLARTNRLLVATGVTSYLPTLTSQRPAVYHEVLPLLAPTRHARNPALGAEPLGTHCEGPFLSAKKPGIHAPAVLQEPATWPALEACYGKKNLRPSVVRKVTLAPELDPSGGSCDVVRKLVAQGIVVSIGHTAATNAEARAAVEAGATMVTHMFNAMPQPHHRDTGVFGLLGGDGSGGGSTTTQSPTQDLPSAIAAVPQRRRRPFFGLITDGVHVAPPMCAIAYQAYPEGCIVVTDSLHVLGLPDGVYAWPNGGRIRKQGLRCTSLDGKTLAGASATLDQCVTHLIRWTGIGVAEGLCTVTSHPAKLLGIEGTKGNLVVGADADLVVLGEEGSGNEWKMTVDEVWKFGSKVFDANAPEERKKEERKAML